MGFRLDIPIIRRKTGESLRNFRDMIPPSAARKFFKEMLPHPPPKVDVLFLWGILSLTACAFLGEYSLIIAALVITMLVGLWFGNHMTRHLLFLGLSIFLGYSLNLAFFAITPYVTETSIRLGFIYWAVAMSIPVIMGNTIYHFRKYFTTGDVTKEEVMSLCIYAISFAMLSGIFRISNYTTIIHFCFVFYSLYLLYLGITIRLGFEQAGTCFMFAIVTSAIYSLVLFKLAAVILGIPVFLYIF